MFVCVSLNFLILKGQGNLLLGSSREDSVSFSRSSIWLHGFLFHEFPWQQIAFAHSGSNGFYPPFGRWVWEKVGISIAMLGAVKQLVWNERSRTGLRENPVGEISQKQKTVCFSTRCWFLKIFFGIFYADNFGEDETTTWHSIFFLMGDSTTNRHPQNEHLNTSPEKGPFQKENSLPNQHFSGVHKLPVTVVFVRAQIFEELHCWNCLRSQALLTSIGQISGIMVLYALTCAMVGVLECHQIDYLIII